MLRTSFWTLALALGLLLAPPLPAASIQDEASAPAQSLESRVTALETRVRELAREVDQLPVGMILFLTGAFCALWAQNTGRSAWLWFFLGLFFNVFTLVAVLVKNGREA